MVAAVATTMVAVATPSEMVVRFRHNNNDAVDSAATEVVAFQTCVEEYSVPLDNACYINIPNDTDIA